MSNRRNPTPGLGEGNILCQLQPEACHGCERPFGIGNDSTMFVAPAPGEPNAPKPGWRPMKCVECGTIQYIPERGRAQEFY